ncbi:type IV pilus modification PilV family protein [Acidocella sp.]|uniref:type IV pilus modification PilV family protein n=1 Tax=Acidocella sp. TaxID=50710 RepID=UPI003CFFC609
MRHPKLRHRFIRSSPKPPLSLELASSSPSTLSPSTLSPGTLSPGSARAKTNQLGFTLLEVLVAFVIAALATLVLYKAGFNGAAQSVTAARYQEAVARAQSRLASIGRLTTLKPESLSGEDGGGFHWRLEIAALRSGGGFGLYAVRVSESFGERQVTLTTELLGPPAQ